MSRRKEPDWNSFPRSLRCTCGHISGEHMIGYCIVEGCGCFSFGDAVESAPADGETPVNRDGGADRTEQGES